MNFSLLISFILFTIILNLIYLYLLKVIFLNDYSILLTLDFLERIYLFFMDFFVIHFMHLDTTIYTYIYKFEDNPIKFLLFQLFIIFFLSVNCFFLIYLIVSNFLVLILRKNIKQFRFPSKYGSFSVSFASILLFSRINWYINDHVLFGADIVYTWHLVCAHVMVPSFLSVLLL